MRDHLFFFLNGEPTTIRGQAALSMLAHYLRREKGLCGTKIACDQGACGSCSVLVGKPKDGEISYAAVNSCIFPLYNCDGCHIVTVEGLSGPATPGSPEPLSEVQEALVQCHGAQCGFCTPGIAIALTAFQQNAMEGDEGDTQEQVCQALEGNLCRCTGYSAIIESGIAVGRTNFKSLTSLYPSTPLLQTLSQKQSEPAAIASDALFLPVTLEDALSWKAAHPQATVVSGGTETNVQINVESFHPNGIMSLAHVPGLDELVIANDALTLGARATWNQVATFVQDKVPELAKLLRRWGSPQLRQTGTVGGNIVRAAAISDSLPFLLVCEAQLELASQTSTRTVDIESFLSNGKPGIKPDELLLRIHVPLPAPAQTLRLFKVAKRRAFDRSIASAAFLLTHQNGVIEKIHVAYGGVAPSAIRLHRIEEFLTGKPVAEIGGDAAREIAQGEISPVSDAKAGAAYRRRLVANLLKRFSDELAGGES